MVRRKYKIRLTLLAILLVLSLTVEFDYQLWKIDNRQTDLAITESGCVEIIYSDDKSFNLVNPEATKDSDGPRTIPKTISISNNCSDIKTINVTMDVLNTSSIESNKVKVYINGEELPESYLQPGVTTGRNDSHGAYVDISVPENCVFAMGDNRKQSTDCRAFGCIPLDKIEGKVWIRFWPLELWGEV